MTAPIEDEFDQRLAIATAEGAPARFWPMVREALAGSRRDLTAMPLGRAVFVLAVPMVLEMVMESIFARLRRLLGVACSAPTPWRPSA